MSSCTPKYLKEINDPYLTWSLISSSNIQYDNFYTYFNTNEGPNGTYYIKSNTFNQFKAPIIFLNDGTPNFKINSIDYDKINSGITNGMTFIYKDDHTPNPDKWTYTWYESDTNSTIKIIPNINCPTKPTPTPKPDKSMTCQPKCSQQLPQPYSGFCDPTLFFDKNYTGKWSIITQEGKVYSNFDLQYSLDRGVNFVSLYDPNDTTPSGFQLTLQMIDLNGDISYYYVLSMTEPDNIKTGIQVGDGFYYDILTGSYKCERYINGKVTQINIKVLPSTCLSIQKYYKCENKKCIECDGCTDYLTSDCNNECNPPPPPQKQYYKCENKKCIECDGCTDYLTSDCNNQCNLPPSTPSTPSTSSSKFLFFIIAILFLIIIIGGFIFFNNKKKYK